MAFPEQTLTALRERTARAFIRRRLVRSVTGPAYARRSGLKPYDLGHLSLFGDHEAIGPLQRDEALLLYALTQVMRPQVVVEMGFLWGRSALNFLVALPGDAHLHSFDISDEAQEIARTQFSGLPNFTFHRVSQVDVAPHHVGGRPVDLVLLDAAHDLELNQRTFERLHGMLAPGGILAIHDTGTWLRHAMRPAHHEFARSQGDDAWLSADEFQHQRGERLFVNWILGEHPEFSVLNLHTTATLRHGLTLVQRRTILPVGPAPAA